MSARPKPAALVLQDLVYLVGAAVTYGGAFALARAAVRPVVGRVPELVAPVVAFAVGAPVFLAAALVPPIVVHRLLPALEPGFYRTSDRAFVLWALRFVFQRIVNLWPVRQVLFYSHVLRWALLNGLGSRVAFDTLMSSDVVILDWHMLRIGRRCSFGGSTTFGTHFMAEGRLVLGTIEAGDDVDVGGQSVLGPEVRLGDGAKLGFGVTVGPFCRLAAGAVVRESAKLGERCVVGEGAVVEADALVAPGTEIPAGERWGGRPAVKVGEVRRRPARPAR